MAIWPHDWPHWQEAFWSNWALVIVGGIAGYLAWRTLRKIGIQADVMGRQLAVQEAEFLQWVEVGDWEVKPQAIVDYQVSGNTVVRKPDEIDVRIRFPIVNNTSRPLSICAVQTKIQVSPTEDTTKYALEEKRPVPPKGKYVVIIDTKLTGLQVDAYLMNYLFMTVSIKVSFANALGNSDSADFDRLEICGIDKTISLEKGYVSQPTKAL